MQNNKVKIPNLFSAQGSDVFYEDVRNEIYAWHHAAKIYWQELYEKYHVFVDSDFPSSFRADCFSRLWELTQANFIAAHRNAGVKILRMKGKNVSKPDFCFTLQDTIFYLEAVCASTGNIPALNDQRTEVARCTPIAENMERLCTSIREKGHTKYYGQETCGYKCNVEENSGFIIAISLAKIPWINRTGNFQNDLRCIFGMSAPMIPIIEDTKGQRSMGNPYHTAQQSFEKVTKKTNDPAPIKIDYFASDEYSHISAILISYTDCTFFPEIDQYLPFINWRHCQNDYLLVHNPFAKVKLPVGFFNVLREVTATIVDGGMEINVADKTVANAQKTEEVA